MDGAWSLIYGRAAEPHLRTGSGTLIYGQAAGASSKDGQRNPHPADGRLEPSCGTGSGALITQTGSGTLIYGRAAEPSSMGRAAEPSSRTGSGTLIHQMGGRNPHLRTGGWNPGPRPGGRSQSTGQPAGRGGRQGAPPLEPPWPAPQSGNSLSRAHCTQRGWHPSPLQGCASGQRTHGGTSEGLWQWRCGCSVSRLWSHRACPDGLCRDGGLVRTPWEPPQPAALGLCSPDGPDPTPEHPHSRASGVTVEQHAAAARGSHWARKRSQLPRSRF